jgi:hypothetical protein
MILQRFIMKECKLANTLIHVFLNLFEEKYPKTQEDIEDIS